jgi:hypothetical protein
MMENKDIIATAQVLVDFEFGYSIIFAVEARCVATTKSCEGRERFSEFLIFACTGNSRIYAIWDLAKKMKFVSNPASYNQLSNFEKQAFFVFVELIRATYKSTILYPER